MVTCLVVLERMRDSMCLVLAQHLAQQGSQETYGGHVLAYCGPWESHSGSFRLLLCPSLIPRQLSPCSYHGRAMSTALHYMLVSFQLVREIPGHPVHTSYLEPADRGIGPTGASVWVPRDGAGQETGYTHLWGHLEDAQLLGIGQGGIQWKDQHRGAAVWKVLGDVPAGLTHGFDLLLPGEEHQDVMRGGGFLQRRQSGVTGVTGP